ncbi:hypothetical protein N8987_04470 [Crocinitomix sp.]|nr:hypothetical protein [Crocinitomix sp.]
MKKKIVMFGVVMIAYAGFSASLRTAGSDIDIYTTYFPAVIGKELVYENFGSNDKLESSEIMTVKDVRDTTGGIVIDAHAISKDKKGEVVLDNDFSFSCIDGVFRISFESIMDASMMDAYKDMEIEMTQTELAFPKSMDVATSLPDGTMTVKIKTNGTQIMTMTMNVTNRKIEAKESITTPADTFEAFKMTETQHTSMMFMNKTYKSVNWIVPGIGSVRSEMYTDKDKLNSYRILTSIK